MSQFDTDEQHQAKVKAWLDKVFAPLTPEEQVFFNGENWLVFDVTTNSDVVFYSYEAALDFASDNGLINALAKTNYTPNPERRAALGLSKPEYLGV